MLIMALSRLLRISVRFSLMLLTICVLKVSFAISVSLLN